MYKVDFLVVSSFQVEKHDSYEKFIVRFWGLKIKPTFRFKPLN